MTGGGGAPGGPVCINGAPPSSLRCAACTRLHSGGWVDRSLVDGPACTRQPRGPPPPAQCARRTGEGFKRALPPCGSECVSFRPPPFDLSRGAAPPTTLMRPAFPGRHAPLSIVAIRAVPLAPAWLPVPSLSRPRGVAHMASRRASCGWGTSSPLVGTCGEPTRGGSEGQPTPARPRMTRVVPPRRGETTTDRAAAVHRRPRGRRRPLAAPARRAVRPLLVRTPPATRRRPPPPAEPPARRPCRPPPDGRRATTGRARPAATVGRRAWQQPPWHVPGGAPGCGRWGVSRPGRPGGLVAPPTAGADRRWRSPLQQAPPPHSAWSRTRR